ncbi:MAG: regulatory protein RecX [Patescibacteria group bacterium]
MIDNQPTPKDYQHIKEKIIDYLSRQGFSEKKLLQKVTDLKRHYHTTRRYDFYTSEHVQKVLDELKAVGLVDDEKFARDILRFLQGRKDGLYRIKDKMRRRLIPTEIINKVLGEWKRSGAVQDYAAIVRETKRKHVRLKEKYPSPKKQYEVKGKLYAFLGQKGYGAEEIKEILRQSME